MVNLYLPNQTGWSRPAGLLKAEAWSGHETRETSDSHQSEFDKHPSGRFSNVGNKCPMRHWYCSRQIARKFSHSTNPTTVTTLEDRQHSDIQIAPFQSDKAYIKSAFCLIKQLGSWQCCRNYRIWTASLNCRMRSSKSVSYRVQEEWLAHVPSLVVEYHVCDRDISMRKNKLWASERGNTNHQTTKPGKVWSSGCIWRSAY